MIWEIDGRKIEFNNPDKIFWPKEGYTKKDLAEYYLSVSEYITPYLKDRPQSMNRFPNGIEGENFYHKNIGEIGPKWLKKINIYSPSNEANEKYLLCQDIQTLIYMINLGCIEINPWSSRAGSLAKPDWAIIDLDPEGISFEEVKKTAKVIKNILDRVGAMGFLKTSGATGLHIYIPFENKYTYEQIKRLAFLIVTVAHNRLPNTTSLERLPKKRQGKIYLDFLQNNKGQTLASPYSVRPKPGAPVSTPLKWEELATDFEPTDFNINNTLKRLKAKGDLFSNVLEYKNDFREILKNLGDLLE